MLCISVVQCLCTQCEGELLHLYEVCLPVISVEHMSSSSPSSDKNVEGFKSGDIYIN